MQLNYENIAHRFQEDIEFRTCMLQHGRTLETILEWDHIASQVGQVQGIPYRERIQRYGYQRAQLALEHGGRNTHNVREASNYDELRARGPPISPDEVPAAKGKNKGKSKGRNPPRSQSHNRWQSWSQSSSTYPYGSSSSSWWWK